VEAKLISLPSYIGQSILKNKNSATCFGSLSHHKAKIKNIVQVHSVRAHIMGSILFTKLYSH